ncbi:MAG TPA: AzlD domain-containing protein [Firmicutes bacterium]|nr:AzlD domain-containing protein [Bacillota bacterium]
MPLSPLHTLAIIAVCSAVTLFTRAFPFLFLSKGKTATKYSVYLAQALPPAVMAMLIVYCLRSTPVLASPHGIPEAAAVAAVILLHLWKRNNLLSILGGTVIYMVLLQGVFA